MGVEADAIDGLYRYLYVVSVSFIQQSLASASLEQVRFELLIELALTIQDSSQYVRIRYVYLKLGAIFAQKVVQVVQNVWLVAVLASVVRCCSIGGMSQVIRCALCLLLYS